MADIVGQYQERLLEAAGAVDRHTAVDERKGTMEAAAPLIELLAGGLIEASDSSSGGQSTRLAVVEYAARLVAAQAANPASLGLQAEIAAAVKLAGVDGAKQALAAKIEERIGKSAAAALDKAPRRRF